MTTASEAAEVLAAARGSTPLAPRGPSSRPLRSAARPPPRARQAAAAPVSAPAPRPAGGLPPSRDAAEVLANLQATFGASRVAAPVQRGPTEFEVEILKPSGKYAWVYGSVPAHALEQAKAELEAAMKGARRA